MDVNEYEKLSPVEQNKWLFKVVLGIQQLLERQTESMNTRVSSLDTKMETQVEAVRADVQEVNKSVEGLVDRVVNLEKKSAELEVSMANVVADNADIKDETFNTLPEGFMPGTRLIADKIAQRNQAMNNSMSWQRSRGRNPEEKPRMVASGFRTINGGSLQQEDKIIRFWEVAGVDAKNTVFDGIFMWWPTEAEIKAADFNTINFFEAGLSVMQVNWCKSLVYVPDRSMYAQQGDDNVARFNETCAKLDDNFRKNSPEFATDDYVIFFDAFLERFWMAVRRYNMTNHQLCKEILYEKCVGVREVCAYTLKPTDQENRILSFKGYMCKMRETFLPPDMKNVCKGAYLSVKQNENDKIDAFFDKIVSFWKRAYPAPTEDMYMDFYYQVCNVLLSPVLATQMRQVSLDMERDGQVQMISKFRTELIVRAQLIIQGLQHNQISGQMARGCASNQMVLAKQIIGGIGTKNNPITIDQVSNDDVVCEDIDQCDVGLSEEYDGPKEWLPIIGAVQKSWVCFYCDKRGHLMRDCFDIRDKKLPNPKGKYFKRYGNKPFIPYKKVEGKKDGKQNEGKVVAEIEEEEEIKVVSYLDGNDDLSEEIEEWNQQIIGDILWY
jgi:uncharacterized Zn-finger protein